MRTLTDNNRSHLAPLDLRRLLRVATVVVAAVTTSSSEAAQYLTVYGGPAYNETTQTGLQWPTLSASPGSTVAGNGVAVGGSTKFTAGKWLGTRAVRWDAASGAAVELGNLGTNSYGVTDSEAYAVNPAGTAVGFAEKHIGGTSHYQAVRWDASGTVATELGNFGADASSIAYAINAAGTAAGFAAGGGAVRWDASGNVTALGNLGSGFCQAYAINDAGTAVGSSETASSSWPHAVRWDGSGTAVTQLASLGSVGGDAFSEALCVNSSGAAAGYSFKYVDGDVGSRAVRWDASSAAATELGDLGTDTRGVTSSKAHAINDAGTAIGYAVKYTDDGTYVGRRAVRWDAGGAAATELGNLGLPPLGETMANDINAAGITVGTSHRLLNGTTMGRAVLWDVDTIDAIDLNTLIDPAGSWTLVDARGITDTNWISGLGIFDPDGAGGITPYGRAFLIQVPATALPEPSVGCVLLIGAFSVARRGCRIKSS